MKLTCKLTSVICAIALIVLCGCTDVKQNENLSDGVIITYPTNDKVNGYRISQPFEEELKKGSFCYSVNSKKFHLVSCYVVKRINEANLCYSDNKEELISNGMTPCKNCNP